jgi:D-threonate/D-erythronate kinase
VTALARDPLPDPRAAFAAIRMIADDMTGALDTAAAFAGLASPLRVGIAVQDSRSLVLDIGTRERESEDAATAAQAAAALLAPAPGRLSFFKVDSLLRGHAGAELAAILATNRFDRVIIAPALPEQGRRTRSGRQVWIQGGTWTPTGEDLGEALAAAGHPVAQLGPESLPDRGISLFDAETPDDLDRIVANGFAAGGSLLWVGSAGLARALARTVADAPSSDLRWEGPLLALIGTDHAVTAAQLDAVAPLRREATDTAGIIALLGQSGATFVTTALPAGTPRPAAHATIAARFASLVADVPQPGTLLVSGGETLRALLPSLGATGLDVLGELQPGIALSRLTEGRWRGTAVISKSGAFGEPGLFADLATRASSAPTSAGKIPS